MCVILCYFWILEKRENWDVGINDLAHFTQIAQIVHSNYSNFLLNDSLYSPDYSKLLTLLTQNEQFTQFTHSLTLLAHFTHFTHFKYLITHFKYSIYSIYSKGLKDTPWNSV